MLSLSVILCVAYFFVLSYWWNLGLVSAGAMIMSGRLPDLVYEIRTGTRPSKKQQGLPYILGMVLILLSLPLTWYALCRWAKVGV
jgi:hypothetical protein